MAKRLPSQNEVTDRKLHESRAIAIRRADPDATFCPQTSAIPARRRAGYCSAIRTNPENEKLWTGLTGCTGWGREEGLRGTGLWGRIHGLQSHPRRFHGRSLSQSRGPPERSRENREARHLPNTRHSAGVLPKICSGVGYPLFSTRPHR